MVNPKKNTIPIIGARSVEQLVDNIGSLNFSLTDEQIKKLDTVSDIAKPYPFGMIATLGARN